MKQILLIAFLFLPVFIFAQIRSATDSGIYHTGNLRDAYNGAEIVMEKPYKLPEFPGGHIMLINYFQSCINKAVPLINKALPGTYNVMVRFKVDTTGNVKEIYPETNYGFGMETEVKRCLTNSPVWKPAILKTGERVAYINRQIVIYIIKSRTDIRVEIK